MERKDKSEVRVIYTIHIELKDLALPLGHFFFPSIKINHITDVAIYVTMSKGQLNQPAMWVLGCQVDSLPSKAVQPHTTLLKCVPL